MTMIHLPAVDAKIRHLSAGNGLIVIGDLGTRRLVGLILKGIVRVLDILRLRRWRAPGLGPARGVRVMSPVPVWGGRV